MDFIPNDIITEGVVKIRIEAVGGDLDRVACRYPTSFMNEMARQLTSAIESATGAEGIADSSVELVMMFATSTYMEHISGNVTYRRLMLIDAVSAPRDFWVKWTRLGEIDGVYSAENILFELGEDVDQKIREREYRYLLQSGGEKYHNSMSRKKVTEWREVIRRAAKRGELSKVESDFELAPETLELEARIADLLGKRLAPKEEEAKAEIPFIHSDESEFEMAMAKMRMVVEESTEAEETPIPEEENFLPEEVKISSADEEEFVPETEEISFADEEENPEELKVEIESEISDEEDNHKTEEFLFDEVVDEPESLPAASPFDVIVNEKITEEIEFIFDRPASADGESELVFEELDSPVTEEVPVSAEAGFVADEDVDPMELEDSDEESEDEVEIEIIEEDPEIDVEIPEDESEIEIEIVEEDPEVEELIEETEEIIEEVIEEVEEIAEEILEEEDVEAEQTPEPAVFEPISIADRVADIRAELEIKIRLEYEIKAREKAEAELIELRRQLQRAQTESEKTVAELIKENERLRLEYEYLKEQTENERLVREAEEARLRVEEQQLRAQIETQLRSEAAERERLAEAARMAIEEQHRLEAENARIARQKEEEERIEAEKRRREEQERELEQIRQAELDRIRREDEEARARAKAAMPEMGDGRYSYTSKTVKFLFRKNVDPNITTRIQEIIKATVDYYGKDGVYLRIKATVPDTQTVILEFAQIPIEEMPLLGNIIKILGNSGLGIAKAIIE